MELFDLRLWSGFQHAGGDMSAPAMIQQVSIDSRQLNSADSLFVPLVGNVFDGHQFIQDVADAGIYYALVNKEWDSSSLTQFHALKLLRVDSPLKAFQEIARAYRLQFTCQVIAVIGSFGKTMVKDLLQALIKNHCNVIASPESFNSQIGVALSLFRIKREHDVAIIEAGFSEIGEMHILTDIITPTSAILTHIGKKHLPSIGSLALSASQMMHLIQSIPANGWVLLPKDPIIDKFVPSIKAHIHYWDSADVQDLPIATATSSVHNGIKPYHIGFPDLTNFYANATFGFYYILDLLNISTGAAWLLKTPSKIICQALLQHVSEPTRTEIWQSPTGITFINETYCSDLQSIDRAFKYFNQLPVKGAKIFIFGGMRTDEKSQLKAHYKHIAQRINKAKLNTVFLVGDHQFTSLMQEMKSIAPQLNMQQFTTHKEAYHSLQGILKQHDTVLIKGEHKQPFDQITESFNDSICNNQCFVNLAAIKSNLTAMRSKLGKKTRIMVIVKAFAYGTNDVRMAKFLATCAIDILGVSYVEEGVTLRRSGVTQDIFALNAALYEVVRVVKWNLQIGVSSAELIHALANEALRCNKKIKIHIHVDTGMSRLGCRPEEAINLAKLISESPALILEGIMTHFACADNAEQDPFTLSQVNCFDNVIQILESAGYYLPWKHAANSAGIMRFNFPQYNMVRVGLAVYGLYPSAAAKESFELELALTLLSRIVGINQCKEGETVSYGRNYKVTKKEQLIAVLPVGYFDGLHRNYSGKGEVLIRGKKVPMVGNICMDYMMVDVSEVPDVEIGDSVLIFGEDEYGNFLSPEALARSGDSIIHELVTCLGPRIHRIFIHEEAAHHNTKFSYSF